LELLKLANENRFEYLWLPLSNIRTITCQAVLLIADGVRPNPSNNPSYELAEMSLNRQGNEQYPILDSLDSHTINDEQRRDTVSRQVALIMVRHTV